MEITDPVFNFDRYLWLNMSKFLKWCPARSKVCKIRTKPNYFLFGFFHYNLSHGLRAKLSVLVIMVLKMHPTQINKKFYYY